VFSGIKGINSRTTAWAAFVRHLHTDNTDYELTTREKDEGRWSERQIERERESATDYDRVKS